MAQNSTVELHYQTWHVGHSTEPVVLLHGLFGSLTNWASIARRLPTHWVVAPDLRNHGRSPHHDDVSYAAMSRDLVALLDNLGVTRACLVGHSMGGKLAMQVALRYPERVASLAVVDMAPIAYTHHFDTIFAAYASVDLRRIKNRTEARQQMTAIPLDENIKLFLLQNLHRDGNTWRWRINLPALETNYRTITGYPDAGQATYSGKTRFIYGEQSDYVLPAYHPAIRAAFPNARFCPVADAGHWVHAEQPDQFMHCLNAFLAD